MFNSRNKTRHSALALAALLAAVPGCATINTLNPFSAGAEKPADAAQNASVPVAPESEKEVQPVAANPTAKQIDDLKSDNAKSKKQIAHIRLELQSLKEQLASAQRSIQVLGRGQRSGLFYEDTKKPVAAIGFENSEEDEDGDEDASTPAVHAPVASASPEVRNLNEVPAIAQSSTVAAPAGHTGVDEEVEKNNETATALPARMLADAEYKMSHTQYGEAVVVLSELQKKFPQYDDAGVGSLLLAEAWLKLGEFGNVFPIVHSFYLRHPNSHEFLRAKLSEGLALEGNGSKERAAGIYREIIGLGPQSAYAQQARASLQRMRDAR